MPVITVPMPELIATVEVRGYRRWQVRMWLVLQLIRLAGWIGPMSMTINVETKD